MKDYLSINFYLEPGPIRDILNFRLEKVGVESIEERDDMLIAYFLVEDWEVGEIQIFEYTRNNHILLEINEVKEQNWNAVWEASFDPVNINDFCYVRAPFHKASNIENIIDIILEPRMAFGTAHHETTFMMMSVMESLDFTGAKVFDFGCGTAILSLLAEKLGAKDIYAVDIEENAIENAKYNAEINGCTNINSEQKVLAELAVTAYDYILANINRQVLLDSASDLVAFLKEKGTLLISGILVKDEELVRQAYTEAGFKHIKTLNKGEWLCMQFTHA